MSRGDTNQVNEKYDASNATNEMHVMAYDGSLRNNDYISFSDNAANTLELTAHSNTADLTNVDGTLHNIIVNDDQDVDSTNTHYTSTLNLNTDVLADANNALVVTATELDNANNDFTFDGSAETDGNIEVYSGAGDDNITTGAGNDIVYGGAGDDIIKTHLGDDKAYGEDGDDNITTGQGNDIVDGGNGNDNIKTYAGTDDITGGTGNDTIDAGKDDDIIHAGTGRDTVTGGLGADTIDLGADSDVDTVKYDDELESDGLHLDDIINFNVADDVLDFSAITAGAGDYVGEVATYANINAALTGTAGEAILTQDTSMLYIDIDGSGDINNGDMQIHLDGVTDMDETTDANFAF
jgi:Ca2+-binding RTX toxin-like protein